METLYIKREWVEGEGEETKQFTLEELQTMQETLSMLPEEFSEFITGYSCDSYADESVASLETLWVDCYSSRDNLSLEEKEGIHNFLMRSEHEYLTCYTVWRLWNSQFTEEEAHKLWRESGVATLEGIIGE